MRVGEVLLSSFFAALSLAVFLTSDFEVQVFNSADIGPGFYPRLVAGLMLVVSVAQIVVSMRNWRKSDTGYEPIPWKLLATVLGLIVIYNLVFDFDYIITTTLFLIVLMVIGGIRKWTVLAASALGYGLFTYFLFAKFMLMPLPSFF